MGLARNLIQPSIAMVPFFTSVSTLPPKSSSEYGVTMVLSLTNTRLVATFWWNTIQLELNSRVLKLTCTPQPTHNRATAPTTGESIRADPPGTREGWSCSRKRAPCSAGQWGRTLLGLGGTSGLAPSLEPRSGTVRRTAWPAHSQLPRSLRTWSAATEVRLALNTPCSSPSWNPSSTSSLSSCDLALSTCAPSPPTPPTTHFTQSSSIHPVGCAKGLLFAICPSSVPLLEHPHGGDVVAAREPELGLGGICFSAIGSWG